MSAAAPTPHRPYSKVLIANRGEIALRIVRAAHELGLLTVAVYSDADRTALHVRAAHEAVRLGPSAPGASYLKIDAILDACRKTGADAVHPGYGFLAENADFAKQVTDAGMVFIGPSPEAMQAMGDKISARNTVEKSGVPLVPGAELGDTSDPKALMAVAKRVGYPLLVKATAGGGGKGMRLVHEASDLVDAIARASGEAKTAFGNAVVYLERFIEQPRHIEIQILADGHGNTLALGERECSVQRRHQKVIEERPSCIVSDELRARMETAAIATARSCNYEGAGTVEFLVGADGGFYFLEMNTRIQVEHPVTELCYGIDLVQEQLRIARGEAISFADQPPIPSGHAIEARICAEDADAGFLPSTGTLGAIQLPGGPGVRCDGHVYAGQDVTLHYDNMLLKVIVHAATRDAAIARMRRALHETRLPGVTTNLPLLVRTLDHPAFAEGNYDTSILEHATKAKPDDSLIPVIAAALAKHRRVRRRVVPSAEEGGTSLSPWVLAGRMRTSGGGWGAAR